MRARTTLASRRLARGLTLIELMVAVAIGGFLMIGALTVFVQSRTTYRSTEGVSRLQENARFALAAIEPDIRLASYYGLTTRGTRINGRATTTQPNSGLAPANCGSNWPIDLENPVVATNGAWAWGGCANATDDGGYLAGTDTIVLRRVSQATVVPAGGGIYVQSARFQPGQVFTGGTVPAGYLPATSQTFQLMTTGYYIAQRSRTSLNVKGDNIPSLHRIRIMSATMIQDDELLAGVEDMQIELGVDTDAVGAPNRGSIDRYVNADDPILNPANPNVVILSVRIWLRVRAEDTENGFSDTTTNYAYANVNYAPAGAERSFRRLLVSKTIYLRNMRQMS